MPGYFLDTSALAKRYHLEIGSDYVDRIVEELGSRSVISYLAVVEFQSVLALKARRREINEHALPLYRRRFLADVARQQISIALPAVHERYYRRAMTLLIEYRVAEGLRTLDALQLAIALDLRELGEIDVLVAAHQTLCRVAALAGCSAVNPEKPGSTLS